MEMLERLQPEQLSQHADSIVKLLSKARTALQPADSCTALSALGQFHHEILRSHADDIMELLSCKEPAVRLAALNVLGRIDAEHLVHHAHAFPPLIADDAAGVRAAVMPILHRLPAHILESHTQRIADNLMCDEPDVQCTALTLLTKLQPHKLAQVVDPRAAILLYPGVSASTSEPSLQWLKRHVGDDWGKPKTMQQEQHVIVLIRVRHQFEYYAYNTGILLESNVKYFKYEYDTAV